MIKHIVMWNLRGDTEAAKAQAVSVLKRSFESLRGRIPGLLDFHSGPYDSAEGLNDGYTHGFIMTFASPQARDEYLPHPVHEEVKAIVVPCLERVVVFDFNLPE